MVDMKDVTVRPAQLSDAHGILDVYAPYILHSFITFENEVPAIDAFAQRIAHYGQRFPWLVCEVDGTIAGYVYASPHRDRAAYQWCCESSIYMHEKFKGRGTGKVLYQTLFDLLKCQGLRRVYAGITLPNEASVRLHEGLGFQWLATYDHVGYKMGEWKDVGWWQLQLNPFDALPNCLHLLQRFHKKFGRMHVRKPGIKSASCWRGKHDTACLHIATVQPTKKAISSLRANSFPLMLRLLFNFFGSRSRSPTSECSDCYLY